MDICQQPAISALIDQAIAFSFDVSYYSTLLCQWGKSLMARLAFPIVIARPKLRRDEFGPAKQRQEVCQ